MPRTLKTTFEGKDLMRTYRIASLFTIKTDCDFRAQTNREIDVLNSVFQCYGCRSGMLTGQGERAHPERRWGGIHKGKYENTSMYGLKFYMIDGDLLSLISVCSFLRTR